MKKAYNRFLWHLKELNKTFSNEPSYYSAKRLERFALFLLANFSLEWYIWEHHAELNTNDILLIYGARMVYAGFVTKQTQKDKQDESTNNNTTDTTSV